MKKRADLLENGKYKRISIWNALDWKRNKPELWDEYKENLYSINKKPENKVPLIFQSGRNGIDSKSYFRYKNAEYDKQGEGSEESYRHEFFKECISRMHILELRWYGEAIKIEVDDIQQEETIIMADGGKRIVDLYVKFSKSDPAFYVEKWDGQLAIEICDTHPVDDKKKKQMKDNGISVFEFTVNQWNIKDDFNSEEEEEKKYQVIFDKLAGENHGHIRGKLLVDSTSRKHFSTRLYEEEREEKERIEKKIIILKRSYREHLEQEKTLKAQIVKKDRDIQKHEQAIEKLMCNIQESRDELQNIQCKWWYKLFIRK